MFTIRWDYGRVCTGVVLVVKELGFLNVRSVEALHVAQTVPCNEDQHTLPQSNPQLYAERTSALMYLRQNPLPMDLAENLHTYVFLGVEHNV